VIPDFVLASIAHSATAGELNTQIARYGCIGWVVPNEALWCAVKLMTQSGYSGIGKYA
jgi:hypothetical protein